MNTTAAFDPAAEDYDRQMNHSLGRWLRGRVQRRLGQCFPAGAEVLELGCGTGEDALFLASRGVHVVGLDASAAMLDQAAAKLARQGMADRVVLRTCDLNQDGLGQLDGVGQRRFDGVFANFGVINCVWQRPRLSKELVERVRPGGVVLLVAMGRWCLFEIVFHLLRLRPVVALRRLRKTSEAHTGAGTRLRVDYPSPAGLAREFAEAGFVMERTWALGTFMPPTDMTHLVDRFPRWFAAVERLDRHWRIWPQLADHFVLELRRR